LEAKFVEQQVQVGLGLSVAGQHQFAPVGGRHVHEHLHGGKFVEHAARAKTRRKGVQPARERDVQAVGQEGDEDVRFDALRVLVEARADCQVALEILEGLFPGSTS
jgi:hypothetical protein